MDFVEVTDRVTECPKHQDIAEALGMTSVQSVRQARLDGSASNYRPPPEGWETGLARLVRDRIAELEQLAEELELHTRAAPSRPPPGAPRPSQVLVAYLDEAIEIFRGTEPTKENRAEFQRALEALDRLLRGVRNFDRNAFPSGFSDRVVNARWELNAGEVRAARRLLEALRGDWERYWS